MWALLKTGLVVLVEHVLTPRGNDMYPGTWTDGHLSPTENLPKFGDSFNQAIMCFGLPGRSRLRIVCLNFDRLLKESD